MPWLCHRATHGLSVHEAPVRCDESRRLPPPTRPHHHFGGRKLNYDALSYALNFDEGHGASPKGDYTGYRDFSARFVGPPASAKSSMDLGGRDAPPLFNPPPQPPHDGAGWA